MIFHVVLSAVGLLPITGIGLRMKGARGAVLVTVYLFLVGLMAMHLA